MNGARYSQDSQSSQDSRDSKEVHPSDKLGSPSSGITLGSQDTPPHKRDPKVEQGDVEERTPESFKGHSSDE